MDPIMLCPMAPKMAVFSQGVSVMIAACVYDHCLPDINQATPSEQLMNDLNIDK